jgi:pyrophosphatase PpaX
VARIFQEIYLGKKLFRGSPLRYGRGPGLVQKEKLIFPKPLLQRIHKQGVRMGIVTGRNRFEAEYALKRFGIRAYFDALVTIDEVRKEEKKTGKLLSRPHPWPVLEAARRMGGGVRRFLSIGDLPDDVLSAQRAKKGLRIQSAAFPRYARDPQATLQEFKKVKPDYFLQKPQDLLKILSS